jgi:hypothetical protein
MRQASRLASASVCQLGHAPETSFPIGSAILRLKPHRQRSLGNRDGSHVTSKVKLPRRVSLSVCLCLSEARRPSQAGGKRATRQAGRERERDGGDRAPPPSYVQKKVAAAAPRGHSVPEVARGSPSAGRPTPRAAPRRETGLPNGPRPARGATPDPGLAIGPARAASSPLC